MHQRNKNASIFRHLVGTGLSRPLSMAMPLIRCGMYTEIAGRLSRRSRDAREARPPARQGQLKIRVSENFLAYLTSFLKFGLLAYRLAWPPPVYPFRHPWTTVQIEGTCRSLKNEWRYGLINGRGRWQSWARFGLNWVKCSTNLMNQRLFFKVPVGRIDEVLDMRGQITVCAVL